MSQAGLVDVEGSHPQIPTLFVCDVGSAIPISNTLEILGSAVAAHSVPLQTVGSGNTVNIDVQYSSAAGSSVATNAGVASFNSAQFTVDANGFVTLAGGGTVESFSVDAFTAPGTNPVVPSGLGIVTITGAQVAAGTTTNVIRTNSLAANSYTIEIQRSQAVGVSTIGDNGVCHFNSTFFTVDANGFVSLNSSGIGQTITGNTGGALSPTAGNWNILGAYTAAGSIPVQTSGSVSTLTVQVQTSQAIAATDATKIGLAAFDSGSFSVDANGFVTLKGGSEAIDSIGVDATSGTGTNPVLPTAAGLITVNGATVAAGTNPIRTVSTAPNIYQIQNQISQAIAATDVTKIGLANFDSAAFDVDANGFVQLNGGGIAATSFDVQANTAPGTDPVVPTAAGVITVNGAAVANHSVVLETRSRAANAYNLEIQYATSAAATDATKSGVAHFNSAQFTVDANGFVSTSGTGIPNTITGDSGGALSPTAGNWNILGRSGSKTAGSGSTLTISSPPFSQVGSSATSVLNSGEIVTAAVTRTLPATAGLVDGDLVIFTCTTAGALVVTANTGQKIRIGTSESTSGGTATSSVAGDSLTLRFDATAIIWRSLSVQGNWITA